MLISMFDVIHDITVAKTGSLAKEEGFTKAFDAYMISRYLSMDKETFEAGLKFSEICDTMTPEQGYAYLIKRCPRIRHRIRYIKKTSKEKKDKTSEDPEDQQNMIESEFGIQ